LIFEPLFSYGKKDIIGLLYGISYLAIIYVSYKFADNPLILIAAGPIIFVGIMYLLIFYFEKFGKIVRVENKDTKNN
jgi:hypothetical protein